MNTPPLLLALVPDWISNWLTPLWIVAVGVTLGLLILAALWGIVALFSRRSAAEIWETSTEGVLQWILSLGVMMAALVLAGFFFVRAPLDLLTSVQRLAQAGPRNFSLDLPAGDLSGGLSGNRPTEIPTSFLGEELKRVSVDSDVDLLIAAKKLDNDVMPGDAGTVEVKSGVRYLWGRTLESVPPLGADAVSTVYLYNLSDQAGHVDLNLEIAPHHDREAATIPVAAIGTVLFFVFFWIIRLALPKVAAIAHTTAKSEMAQPLFVINLLLGSFLLIVFVYIPYNTLGEDIKMLKDSGFAALMVLGMIQAVWAASTSVFEEVEGRTALTVLSKPIGRRQFILGKFTGIVSLVALLFVVLGFLFLVVVAYKPIYDARETANLPPTWEQCFEEVRLTLPGLLLAFMETVVLAGVSVAISTRLPMLANFIVCCTIYVLGHLTPLIVQSSVAVFEPVVFVGTLIATLIPVLDHFNVQAAVAAGAEVPGQYLAMTLLYCTLYSAVTMLLALALFEDRDLA